MGKFAAGSERPYLLLDVEPPYQARVEYAFKVREQMSEVAKKMWHDEVHSSDKGVAPLPPLFDRANVRGILRKSQEEDPRAAGGGERDAP